MGRWKDLLLPIIPLCMPQSFRTHTINMAFICLFTLIFVNEFLMLHHRSPWAKSIAATIMWFIAPLYNFIKKVLNYVELPTQRTNQHRRFVRCLTNSLLKVPLIKYNLITLVLQIKIIFNCRISSGTYKHALGL